MVHYKFASKVSSYPIIILATLPMDFVCLDCVNAFPQLKRKGYDKDH